MSEVFQYDPDDPVAVDARARILDVLLPLTQLFADGFRGDGVHEQLAEFNRRLNELGRHSRASDLVLLTIVLELVLGANRAAGALALATGSSTEQIVRAVFE